MRQIQSTIEIKKMNMRKECWRTVKLWHSTHDRYEEGKKEKLTLRSDEKINQHDFFGEILSWWRGILEGFRGGVVIFGKWGISPCRRDVIFIYFLKCKLPKLLGMCKGKIQPVCGRNEECVQGKNFDYVWPLPMTLLALSGLVMGPFYVCWGMGWSVQRARVRWKGAKHNMEWGL